MCKQLLVVEFEIREQCDTVNVGLKMKVTKNGWNKVGTEPLLMVEKVNTTNKLRSPLFLYITCSV